MLRVHHFGQFYDADESTVVYFDAYTGDTHLISDFAAHVLEQLSVGPLDMDDLLSRMASSTVSLDEAELKESTLNVLEQLVALDIVKQD